MQPNLEACVFHIVFICSSGLLVFRESCSVFLRALLNLTLMILTMGNFGI